MHKTTYINSEYAVSEIVGGLILVLIAFVVIAAIYMYVFPLPLPPAELNVHLAGYVNSQGNVVLEHMGGETLSSYEVYVDGVFSYESTGWDIGEKYLPATAPLYDENDHVQITVYALSEDGSKPIVFDGIINGKTQIETQTVPPTAPPMQISSLRTNTIDEDIICYMDSIVTTINPLTYIYNWMVDKGGNEQSLTRVLMPFDTNSASLVKDYSGNNYNGTATEATWTNQGKVGGAYSFNGVGYIGFPYCFSSSSIDKITVESWMKTSADSVSIASFDRNKYWELGINNGKLRWLTTANDGTASTTSMSSVNDNNWHYVAATYDSSTGMSSIFLDGVLDQTMQAHLLGKTLGIDAVLSGFIGKSTKADRQTIFSTSFETLDEKSKWQENNGTQQQPITWDTLRYDVFNSVWGSYTSGGSDAYLTNSYKHEGTGSACIRDNSGTSSAFTLTNSIDVNAPGYISLLIDFWWMWNDNGWATGEDWWVQYYNGASWVTVLDVNYPSGYSKDVWYHTLFYINESDYVFPSNMKIRFQCDASDNYDKVYIDQLYINATAISRMDLSFDLRNAPTLNPHSGVYSIGGSGDFDPVVAAYNRTGIDVTQYENITVSFWYSYKNTEAGDLLGLYYLNNGVWIPLLQLSDPQSPSGQSVWSYLEVSIPTTLENLNLQFRWTTSAVDEYVAIDDLTITGVPLGGGENFTGILDEFRIYDRVLSSEQIYQNYLCTKDGNSDQSVIVSEELVLGDIWRCIVTPNNSIIDDVSTESNRLQVVMYTGGGG
ncbi:MAG: LamG domain-containing protein [Euryarchaeota archaeon]|nr:LamG domain-containing protein [Euryarchaeota archaeon]